MAPLVVYGAFGTGKTEALAQTALKLASQPDNKTRVLICTHTNAYVTFTTVIISGPPLLDTIRLRV